MAGGATKKTVNAHPKVMRIPADLRVLRQYAEPIIQEMRKDHNSRMSRGKK